MVSPRSNSTQNSPSEATSSQPGVNYITTNRFYVEIGGNIAASFSECSGLDVQIEKETYLEGGVNDQQRIFLKQAKFNDIILKRGMTDDITFWEWLDKVLDLGRSASNLGSGGNSGGLRRNVTILVFNQAGETMQSWTLIGAVPVGWKTPSLQADGNSVAIEELTLTYEGLKVQSKPPGNSGSISSESPSSNEERGSRDSKGYFAES